MDTELFKQEVQAYLESEMKAVNLKKFWRGHGGSAIIEKIKVLITETDLNVFKPKILVDKFDIIVNFERNLEIYAPAMTEKPICNLSFRQNYDGSVTIWFNILSPQGEKQIKYGTFEPKMPVELNYEDLLENSFISFIRELHPTASEPGSDPILFF